MANHTDRDEMVINAIKSLPALEANLRIAQMRVDIIHDALECLTKGEREIICRMIIDKERLIDAGYEVYVEKTHSYRLRRKALDKLGIALFGKPIECLTEKGGAEE